jgi:hypothetical protein
VRYDELTHGVPDAGAAVAVEAEAGAPTSGPVPTVAA